jgi:pyruvate,water dikinase
MIVESPFRQIRPADSDSLVAWFDELPAQAIAGGKGARLGEMARAGLPVPPGFVVCAAGFRVFLDTTGGREVIVRSMDGLDLNAESKLNQAALSIRDFILSKPLPEPLETAIRKAYSKLGESVPVAVRSSAISEDGEAASFAGQQETYLNVWGAEAVMQSVRACWASFFTPRAIFYRAQKGSLQDCEMAVVVQAMVKAEKSGVMFTVDPVRGRRDHLVIEAVFGLGEAAVSGMVTPDHYVVDRTGGSLAHEFVSVQPVALVYDEQGTGTRQVELSEEQGSARVLTDDEIRRLLDLGLKLEAHFGKPQDIEWSIEGGKLYLLQSRPITTL